MMNNTMSPDLLVRTEPLSRDALESLRVNPETATCVELSAGSELYRMVTAHVAKQDACRSFDLDIGRKGKGCDDDEEDSRAATTSLGLGTFAFDVESPEADGDSDDSLEKVPKAGSKIHAVHHTLGEVVGSDCGATLMRKLVLVCADGVEPIKSFCDGLIASADATVDARFNVYKWHVQHQYWQRTETCTARPLKSVVLPKELKSKIVEDMTDFCAPSTKGWYRDHGVPYKRSYLLHGAPGAGKTSLIQALAGKFKRNVCYLSSLSHPDMSDDSLKAAVQRVPGRSLIVLEDVDALWDEDGRHKKASDKSALTFSGVLNALDGVGGSTGQVFILTTNHRERLDPALIRNGRVDVHLEFTDAKPEQMVMLFQSFYKEAKAELAEKFASRLSELLGERTVSCASLQHYFIMQRKKSAEEAAEEVKKVIEEAEAHGLFKKKDEKKEEKKEEKEEKEEEEEEKKEKDEDKEAGGASKKGASKAKKDSKEVHVHVHVE